MAIGVTTVACGRPAISEVDSLSETGFGPPDTDNPDPTVGPTSAVTTSVPPDPTDTTGTPPGSCEAYELPSEVNISVQGDTFDEVNDFNAPCVEGGQAADALYRWRAPYAGNFVFDTVGSNFDTALVLRSLDCEEVLDCNDDWQDFTSYISRYLDAGEEIMIQVDGFGGDMGDYQLNIRDGGGSQGQCPAGEIFEVPGEWWGPLDIGTNQYSSSCGGEGTPEVGLVFVPPWDGTYYFESWGEVPTSLSLHVDECGGPEIACTPEGWMEVELPAGVPLIIMIDSWEDFPGEVGLWIDYWDAPPPPPPPDGPCPELTLPSDTYVEVFGSTLGAPNSLAGSCGGWEASDHTFEFVPPISGEYRVRTAGSEYDTLVHVREGSCQGPELACNDDTWQLLSQVFFWGEVGVPYIITMDGYGDSAGDYRLEVALQ